MSDTIDEIIRRGIRRLDGDKVDLVTPSAIELNAIRTTLAQQHEQIVKLTLILQMQDAEIERLRAVIDCLDLSSVKLCIFENKHKTRAPPPKVNAPLPGTRESHESESKQLIESEDEEYQDEEDDDEDRDEEEENDEDEDHDEEEDEKDEDEKDEDEKDEEEKEEKDDEDEEEEKDEDEEAEEPSCSVDDNEKVRTSDGQVDEDGYKRDRRANRDGDRDEDEENEVTDEVKGVADSNPSESGEGDMFLVDIGGTQYYTNDAYNGQIYESILEAKENPSSAKGRGRRKIVLCEKRRVGKLVGKFRKGNAIFKQL